jgi:pimeloyl-ACP methyl ester carboxylesterase
LARCGVQPRNPSAMRPLIIDPRRLRSFDGKEITSFSSGRASAPDAVAVIANGLGGTLELWRREIEYLGDQRRFLSWSLRGSPRTVDDHAQDLEAVLDAERIDRADFIGWSVGVQVLFEAHRRLGPRMRSLVLVNGSAGRPFQGITPLRALRGPVRGALSVVERLGGASLGARSAAAWLDRLGVVGRAADSVGRAVLAEGLGALPVKELARNLRVFAEHDAEAVLARIDAPVLVVAGDRDPFVPRERSQQMARRIPRAELLIVRGGAHAAPIEVPELLGLRLERVWTKP